jgi:hypothetical protein
VLDFDNGMGNARQCSPALGYGRPSASNRE